MLSIILLLGMQLIMSYQNKKKLNSQMGLKDFDFGSASSILLTEHWGRQPLCLSMVTSTKNQRCKTAVVKINTAKYTCRMWDWQKKKAQNWGNFGSNTTEPAEDRIRYAFFCSLQKRRMREDFIALYNSLRGGCWHLEKHKKTRYCPSLLKTFP